MNVLGFFGGTSIGIFTEQEHLVLLIVILDTLLQAGVRLKLFMFSLGVQTAEILGHVVNHTSLRPSGKHIKSIRRLIRPASGDELMPLLDVVNFSAAFVDHFAEIVGPLYEVLNEIELTKKRKHRQKLAI